MTYGETISVADTTEALKVMRIEKMRRDMETARSCFWKCKDGSLIRLGEMTLGHLEAALSMLERIEEAHGAFLESLGD